MSAIKQMKLLVSLAQIDGYVAERERNYIRNIGLANNINIDEIDLLFERNHELVIPKDLGEEERFNFIFSLVQLMKIDERMYKEELLFCSTIASQLGYDQQVMFDLMLHVKAAAMKDDEIQSLRELTKSYLDKN
jgi:uncharacterized tellurite resistance protein B-like protein